VEEAVTLYKSREWLPLAMPPVPPSDAAKRAYEALHGPPPTPEQLAEARSLVAAQKARDFGARGLFE
jgi:hypothetical protein